jgi:RNA polymerase sigma-70 factor (sigma-E family)
MRSRTETGSSLDPLTDLYLTHYQALIRLAALLLDDLPSCEDVVQEAYVRLAASAKLPVGDGALPYLRQTVVNLSRSTLRRRLLAARRRSVEPLFSGADPVEELSQRDELVGALRLLPRRQREVIALRYFLDLSESETARVLGVSSGAAKAYASRGLTRLAECLGGRR